ncbi:MAG: TIGR02710 family CRISPR-associated protein [Pirellulaceae bacterium]|nr:MAG: TIGR02710 family CRISPR-associated protein [Pirellulaceae bacterium]
MKLDELLARYSVPQQCRKILLVTVGGSHQPIVRSIRETQPDLVCFICSDDTPNGKGSHVMVEGGGLVIKSNPQLTSPDLPNLVQLTGLQPGTWVVVRVPDCDDLQSCYDTAEQLIQWCHQRWPDAELIVDYTGGTKSMTAGFAAAALDDGACRFQAVTGMRTDLVKVRDRTESVVPLAVHAIFVRRHLRLAAQLVRRFDYGSAVAILEDCLCRYGHGELRHRLSTAVNICRAFEAWDHFDHSEAWGILQSVRDEEVDCYRGPLKRLAASSQTTWELIDDLLANAERRAAQRRFDDAVGRVYRALEMLIQLYLRDGYGIDTSDVQPEQLPEVLRDDYQRRYTASTGRIQVPLLAAWNLATTLGDNAVTQWYKENESRLRDFLQLRNYSLFAHGTTPINAASYKEKVQAVQQFILTGVERASSVVASARRRLRLPQFPQQLKVLSGSEETVS